MEIKHCKRCNRDWCFRGTGRPLRCGKCKTPYWDVEVVGDAVARTAKKPRAEKASGGNSGRNTGRVKAVADGAQGIAVGDGELGRPPEPEARSFVRDIIERFRGVTVTPHEADAIVEELGFVAHGWSRGQQSKS